MTLSMTQTLEGLLGPARDQGRRGTCLAFAMSDCHAALRSPSAALSAEYAHFHAQRRSSRRLDQGALPASMLDAIKLDGQPHETIWPYRPTLPADLAALTPPHDVSPVFRRFGELKAPGFDVIIDVLKSGVPVVVAMYLSDAFYSPTITGLITAPSSELPDPTRRHAVLAVGHGTIGTEPAVLVRNSWGSKWGRNGHGWMARSYLAPRIMKAAILTDDPDVSANTASA